MKIKFFIIFLSLFCFLNNLYCFTLKKFELANGLKVILCKKGTLPIVNINLVYKVGCKDEYNGITGIAHMLEHMSFRGSKNFEDGYLEKFVTTNGGLENATTSFDYTKYYVTIKKGALKKILEIYADMMDNLIIDKNKFLKERNVVYQERLWRTDNSPDGYLYYSLNKLAYLEAPYRWTPIGFASDIKHWRRDDVYNFYRKFYAPNNAVLVITGDINFNRTEKIVKEVFGSKKKKIINSYFTKEPIQKGKRELKLKFVSSNKKLAMAFHIPELSRETTPKLDVLTYYLFARNNALFEKILKREKKMVSAIYGGNQERKYPGLFLLFTTLNKNVSHEEVEKKIWKELNKIKNGKISKKDFKLSKAKAINDYFFSKETVTSLGNALAYYGGLEKLDYYLNYDKYIEAVSIKDLIVITKKFFKEENCSTIYLYPIKGKKVNFKPSISGGLR